MKQKLKSCLHLTVNTGHTYKSLRKDKDTGVLKSILPWLEVGTHGLGQSFPQHFVIVPALPSSIAGFEFILATESREDPTYVTMNFVAPDDESAKTIWPLAERTYLKITDIPYFATQDLAVPRCPTKPPWLATILCGHNDEMHAVAEWGGDFEQCMAWAWLGQWFKAKKGA